MTTVNNAPKTEAAEAVVSACITPAGVQASTDRYALQYWTRDFALAAVPLLIARSQLQAIDAHLAHLLSHARSRPGGETPVLFVSDEREWLRIKIQKSLDRSAESGTANMSFMLKHWLAHGTIESFSAWTTDSELCFAIAALEYLMALDPGRRNPLHDDLRMAALEAIARAERLHVNARGVFIGGDWRDTRTDFADKALLTNQCLLARAYQLCDCSRFGGFAEKYARTKSIIRDHFWTGTYFRDYLGMDEPDLLGNALAILWFELLNAKETELALDALEGDRTPFGYALRTVTIPAVREGERGIMDRVTHSGVIWPWVHGYVILALLKTGRRRRAKAAFDVWNKLDGFSEWYDPATGNGGGSRDQLWSAALYLRCARALNGLDG